MAIRNLWKMKRISLRMRAAYSSLFDTFSVAVCFSAINDETRKILSVNDCLMSAKQ